ncbi:PspC domain-containing protein [Streptococcus thermophilus]|uniref:PspC domain-containing protein n=1 Tax=Streptococcus thermophilus TaxID=1308 RepID=UPI0015C21EB4|nr:PspC domain-containing protein [Streptococcus thermophilus]MCT2941313.1 PspC domain-containing protein [Streptococcus thermophilus]MCT2949835.1 PspC domain-containing protein [Streptococcus thermophilus]MCT2956376.1 PspC domain-containing protein [Streptococcus thermophilus]CAD0121552.1 putative Phage shock protein C,; stress-responsive transcriptional regulator [Streptococcus thermophilus]CAD0132464.1 putative Phage shock protein C,; stress-responsive transcriptional regulator [Streptococc
MPNRFYKIRKNRLVAGVVAGLADKFGWNLTLARVLAIILMVSTQFGIFLYLVLALLLPYKEDIYPEIKLKYGRKRKNAEPVEDEWKW